MINKFIAAVGIELEGPWRKEVPLKYNEKTGAVEGVIGAFKEEVFNHTPEHPELKHLRECVSTPLRYTKHVQEFFDTVKSAYIEEAVTQGMGFHIHWSYNAAKYYDITFTRKFVEQYQRELFRVFADDIKLMARPNYRSPSGTNFYRMDYPPEYFNHSINKKRHDVDRPERYYFINFWRAYRDHGTFEVRIYPATTLIQMRKYLDWHCQFIEEFIEQNLTSDELSIVEECKNPKVPINYTPLSECGRRIERRIIIKRET